MTLNGWRLSNGIQKGAIVVPWLDYPGTTLPMGSGDNGCWI